MNWRTLAAATALTTVLAGCDKIPFIGKKGGGEVADSAALAAAAQRQADSLRAAAARRDSIAAARRAQPAPPSGARRPAAAPPGAPARTALVDEPWTPTLTGTIAPGMTREQVVATWGEPVTERAAGAWSYLFFRNGCEVSCGTFDIVFLQNGQVVDAIVRGPGHEYSGVSSSPRDRPVQFTPPINPQPDGSTP